MITRFTDLLPVLLLLIMVVVAGCGGGSEGDSPVLQVCYRDFIDIPTGGCEGVIFTTHTLGTVFADKEFQYKVGTLANGEFEPTPNGLEVVENCTYRIPSRSDSLFTVVKFIISPQEWSGGYGPYTLYVRLDIDGIGTIAQLPLTLNVVQSPDDLVIVPRGPTYLAKLHGPELEEWDPVEESNVILSSVQAELSYRAELVMGIGEQKWNLLYLSIPHDAVWNARHVDYQFGVIEDNGTIGDLPDGIDVFLKEISCTPLTSCKGSLASVLISSSPTISPGTYNIGIQIEVKGMGTLDMVPITIGVNESSDDIVVTSVGPSYRTNANNSDLESMRIIEDECHEFN